VPLLSSPLVGNTAENSIEPRSRRVSALTWLLYAAFVINEHCFRLALRAGVVLLSGCPAALQLESAYG
jgi:hypothetical protein